MYFLHGHGLRCLLDLNCVLHFRRQAGWGFLKSAIFCVHPTCMPPALNKIAFIKVKKRKQR